MKPITTFAGDAGTGGAPSLPLGDYGPLSPAQLATLDRKLTPAEQKAVTDWQVSQADALLATQRKKGGPTSSTMSVTSKGAVIKSDSSGPGFFSFQVPGIDRPLWQVILGGLGVVAMGVGVYSLATSGRPHRRWARAR
jgi:hypothetical protein